MSVIDITNPFEVFTDIDGDPLKNGFIYIGAAGLNPESNPILVFWDKELTIPAAQPVRTISGYPSRDGSLATIYASASDYSILVKNKNGSLVFSTLNRTSASSEADSFQRGFNALGDLVTDISIKIGDKVKTYGYYTKGDDGDNEYEVVAAGTGTPDGGSYINLTGISGQIKGLFPRGDVRVEQFGANTGRTAFENSSAFQFAANFSNIITSAAGKNFVIDSEIQLTTNDVARSAKKVNLRGSVIVCEHTSAKYVFSFNGSVTNQNSLMQVEGVQCNLNGSACIGMVNFNAGCFTSRVKDSFIYDTAQSDIGGPASNDNAIGIRIFNSFNTYIENVRTNRLRTAVKLESDNAISGFANLTNINIKDSIFQRGGRVSSGVGGLIWFEGNTAADTFNIVNTALKTDKDGASRNRYCFNIQGFINAFAIRDMHMESSENGFFMPSAFTSYMTVSDSLITNVDRVFRCACNGIVSTTNVRYLNKDFYLNWAASTTYSVGDFIFDSTNVHKFYCAVAGTSGSSEPSFDTTTEGSSTTADGTVIWQYIGLARHKIFDVMNPDFYIAGRLISNSSDYDSTFPVGQGAYFGGQRDVIINLSSPAPKAPNDNTTYYYTSGAMAVALPPTNEVRDGYELTFQQRGGAVTITPGSSDRILGLDGTTAGGAITSSKSGSSITVRNQNIGNQFFWCIVAKSGVWYANNYTPGNPNYIVTNYTEDRSFNANSTTVEELADVLATLINDLDHMGYINGTVS